MRPGIYSDISFADYLLIDAISNSYLSKLDTCPANAQVPQEDTASMSLGRAVHTMVLEGDNNFFILPEINKRTKEGKAQYAELLEANKDKHVLTVEEYQTVLDMAGSVYSNPWAAKLLAEGVSEQTLIWHDAKTGRLCKGRPDRIPSGGKSIIVDLKTTQNADKYAFMRSVLTYGYHRQAAFYTDGYAAIEAANNVYHFDTVVLIAVESKAPYRCEVYALDDAVVEYGRKQYRRLMDEDIKCQETGIYPSYKHNEIKTLFLPAYINDDDN